MSCRCSDIRDCHRDITKLSRAIEYLNRFPYAAEQMTEHAETLGREVVSCVDTDRNDAFQKGASQLGSPANRIIVDVIRKIKSEINHLSSCLSSMESEDESYHDDDDDD